MDISKALANSRVHCPMWHFLPGPYQGDPARKNCPRADEHEAQRKEYEADPEAFRKKGHRYG